MEAPTDPAVHSGSRKPVCPTSHLTFKLIRKWDKTKDSVPLVAPVTFQVLNSSHTGLLYWTVQITETSPSAECHARPLPRTVSSNLPKGMNTQAPDKSSSTQRTSIQKAPRVGPWIQTLLTSSSLFLSSFMEIELTYSPVRV